MKNITPEEYRTPEQMKMLELDKIARTQVLTEEDRRYWFLIRELDSAYKVRNIINAEREAAFVPEDHEYPFKPLHLRKIQRDIEKVRKKLVTEYEIQKGERLKRREPRIRFGMAIEEQRFFTGNTAGDGTQREAFAAMGVW